MITYEKKNRIEKKKNKETEENEKKNTRKFERILTINIYQVQ